MNGSETRVATKENVVMTMVLVGVGILSGLYLMSRYDYLLFHSIAELFGVIIACSIFILVWNSRRFADNSYFLFVGIAYLFVGSIDTLHMLAYKGMGVFSGFEGANLAAQLWIIARYCESISFLIAPVFASRKLNVSLVFTCYFAAALLLLSMVFWWQNFPVTYVEGEGLTTFKVLSEYIISFFLLISIFLLIQRKIWFDRRVLQLLIASIVLTIISELAFTLYTDVYGFFNLLGHVLKIVSFYLIYRAVIVTGLTQPYSLLFRNLQETRDNLEREKEKAQAYLDVAEVIMLALNTRGEVILINRKGCEILGYSQEEMVGKNWFDNFLPDQIRSGTRAYFRRLISGQIGPPGYREQPILTKTGEERTVAWFNTVLKDNKNNIYASLSSGVDVSQLKDMEKALEYHMRELERSNQELEQFTSIVSHDLQEPLLTISWSTQRLADKYGEKLDAAANESITFIRQASERMQEMINDLLTYSRVGSKKADFRSTDCEIVLSEALSNLRVSVEQSGARITFELLPTVRANFSQLVELFQNLIGNSIKFRGEEPLRIHIRAEKKEGEWLFLFEDNGIGIDPEFRRRIFDAFQRLHSQEEYPGTGMGLAICRKIVEHHGGRIWVRPSAAGGSTFCFTLPEK